MTFTNAAGPAAALGLADRADDRPESAPQLGLAIVILGPGARSAEDNTQIAQCARTVMSVLRFDALLHSSASSSTSRALSSQFVSRKTA